MGGKTKSAGLPQTLLLKCGAFGNIFGCTFLFLLFKPLFVVFGTFTQNSMLETLAQTQWK